MNGWTIHTETRKNIKARKIDSKKTETKNLNSIRKNRTKGVSKGSKVSRNRVGGHDKKVGASAGITERI